MPVGAEMRILQSECYRSVIEVEVCFTVEVSAIGV